MRVTGSNIVLMPGDIFFGDSHTRVRTLLGSCVAIVVWHPQRKIGGMCHYVLPNREAVAGRPLDGHYANEAMEIFLREMKMRGTLPGDYQTRFFGAANMFAEYAGSCADSGDIQHGMCEGCFSVACRNRQAAFKAAHAHGLTVLETNLGGYEHRMVEFNMIDGKTLVLVSRENAGSQNKKVIFT